jgi:hypothetical protein
MCPGQIGAVVLSGLGNAKAFLFLLGCYWGGCQSQCHKARGSGCNQGTLIHVKTPKFERKTTSWAGHTVAPDRWLWLCPAIQTVSYSSAWHLFQDKGLP